jgi:hypothetical protein
MSKHLAFSSNPVRHIGTPMFADMRLYDRESHQVGSIFEIHYRGQSLGTAEIKAFVVFTFSGERSINETTAYLSFNKPLQQVRKMLQSFYSPLTETAHFAFITLEWKTRNIEYQQALLRDWWAAEQEANNQPHQGQLFNS